MDGTLLCGASVPSESNHQYHYMGDLSEMQRYLDERARVKMVQLNDAGMHHLPRHFVEYELCQMEICWTCQIHISGRAVNRY